MQRCRSHGCILLDCLRKSSTAAIYCLLLLARTPPPFSICSLEKAVSLHALCPVGVLNIPSSIFSEAHISSCGSGLDMGVFNRPRELARTCPCVFGVELYVLPMFSPWVPSSREHRTEIYLLQTWNHICEIYLSSFGGCVFNAVFNTLLSIPGNTLKGPRQQHTLEVFMAPIL